MNIKYYQHMQKHPYFDLCQQQKFDIAYYFD